MEIETVEYNYININDKLNKLEILEKRHYKWAKIIGELKENLCDLYKLSERNQKQINIKFKNSSENYSINKRLEKIEKDNSILFKYMKKFIDD